ncbi:PREDICTED: uncharacterized protein LOC109476652 [Branchiostoma belcheri]|uniref:Uncharacterized protein LOC109476652 n=1 Tax=Branchiostoma belcheri TaxID=7741 RepID=A0A6P4Z962_BRABE|nr:PREDICTED: uncharacterized protein LOC109476652 [Branchiostoma belcheri]
MAACEYTYKAGEYDVSPQMKEDFDRDGFVIVRNLLDAEEVEKLRQTVGGADGGMLSNAFHSADDTGRLVKVCLWKHPGNDVTGIIARSKKVAGTFEKLLGEEVYQYHAKVNIKEPEQGGAFLWHQDYGYWYNNGLLFPDMGTVFIAMDRADKNNGCLQVMRGSHRAGRVDHTRVAGQTGADLGRVKHLEKVLEVVHAELEAGDAIFFHCNVLHRSDANKSNRIRWGYLIAYNRASNDPVYEHYNASYTPLNMVDDSEIKKCTNMTDFSGKCFTDPADNKNISGVKVIGH